MNWKMEMDVKGVSPCPEPIPPAAGSGGCPHQRPHHRDGQPAEPAPAADSGHPERRHGSEKEDKKVGPLRRRPAGAAPAGGAGCPGPRSAGRAGGGRRARSDSRPAAGSPRAALCQRGGGREAGGRRRRLSEDTGAAGRGGAGPPRGPGHRALFRPPCGSGAAGGGPGAAAKVYLSSRGQCRQGRRCPPLASVFTRRRGASHLREGARAPCPSSPAVSLWTGGRLLAAE